MLKISSVIFLTLLFFQNGIAQYSNWLPVADPTSGVTVFMPKLPKYEQQKMLSEKGEVLKTTYSTEFENLTFVLTAQNVFSNSKKENASNIHKLLMLTAIQNLGILKKKEKEKRDNHPYIYTEIPLASGQLIKAIAMVYNNRLIHFYVKGSVENLENEDANFFLNSWFLPFEANEAVEVDSSFEDSLITKLDWTTVALNKDLSVAFPKQPFKKNTIVELGKNDIVITAYAHAALEDRLNYVVTSRTYGNDEGQLMDSALYQYVITQLDQSRKLRRLKNLETSLGQEYTFMKRLKRYRLKLFRQEDTLYQFLVKGNRKSIFRENSNYFFQSIKPSN